MAALVTQILRQRGVRIKHKEENPMPLIMAMPAVVNWSVFWAIFLGGLGWDFRHMRMYSHHMPSAKEAALEMAKWVGLALAVGLYIACFVGTQAGIQYANGYVIEFSLSADNMGVILMTFLAFALPRDHWQKVLWWGIIGMIVMRMTFIFFGVQLVQNFEIALPFFGVLLIRAGFGMLKHDEHKEIKKDELFVVRTMKRLLGRAFITEHREDGRFFERVNVGGVFGWAVTLTLANLLVVEGYDFIFAVDSIPAVLGITDDLFLVTTSNLMAVLGLRSLFFLIAGSIKDIILLPYALWAILCFVGGKMIVENMEAVKNAMIAISTWFWETDFSHVHVDPILSFLLIIGILGGAIGISIGIDRWKKARLANGYAVKEQPTANTADSEASDA